MSAVRWEPESDDEEVQPGQIDLDLAFRNILQVLQNRPADYKLFGVYWWPIKALLKRRFGQAQLYMLGNFQDAETAAMVPSMNLQDTVQAALREYAFNATYPHPDGRVENESGELVSILDNDAGL